MKKLLIFLTILLNLNLWTIAVRADSDSPAPPNSPTPSADGAVLMNAKTGEILFEKNADASYPPASTTKVLTTLLTLENTNLKDKVIVGDGPPKADGSSIGLFPGEEVTIKDLLYGLNLQSGNDCAEALAEYIGGTKEKFAEMMNERASQLGCTDSNFVNPSGLYDKNHRTSAKDLALIVSELIKHPEYLKIAQTLTYVMEPTNKTTEKRYIWNKNSMILPGSHYYYKGALAGKIGYTTESEHSYVAAAERNGQILVVALIHDKFSDFYRDTAKLFDYGFNNFETKTLFNKNDKLKDFTLEDNTSIPILAGDGFMYSAQKGNNSTTAFKLNIDQDTINKVSLKAGEKIGTADIYQDGKAIGYVPIINGISHTKDEAVQTVLNANTQGNSMDWTNPILWLTFLLSIISAAGAVFIKKRPNFIIKIKNRE